MHSQISRHGYDFCSKAAFVRFCEMNHKVLPKSILEDRLDRQSIRIAKRFFSSDIEQELERTAMMLRLNLYTLLETGSRPAMNKELTSTLG